MPIWEVSGWVNRTPSTVMTTTKSVPVSRRTCSASGCRRAVGSGPATAVAHVGRVGERVGDREHLVGRGVVRALVDLQVRRDADARDHDGDHDRLQQEQLLREAPCAHADHPTKCTKP